MNDISIETVLLQLLVLFLLAKVAGVLCEQIKISPVIGEIFAGVLIGNTILYQWLSLDIDLTLFQVLSELGVIFLLFAVGLETPFSELRKVGRTAIQVAVLGVIVPLITGFALITALGHGQTEALFIAAAMVATSVGITARVIKDMNLTQTIESRMIIGAAVIDDVLGMIVLAIVVGIASGGSTPLAIILVSIEGYLIRAYGHLHRVDPTPQREEEDDQQERAQSEPSKRSATASHLFRWPSSSAWVYPLPHRSSAWPPSSGPS